MHQTIPLRSAPAAATPALAAPWLLGAAVSLLALVASAQVRIPLPWTPVPVTLQDLVVLVSAALLGRRAAVLATGAYLGLGAAGLPVFSSGGGLAYLLGPTGGFIAGFVAAAALVPMLPTVGRSTAVIVLSLAAGEAVIHALGVFGLAFAKGLTLPQAFVAGSLTFLPISIAKIGLAATIVRVFGKTVASRFQSDRND